MTAALADGTTTGPIHVTLRAIDTAMQLHYYLYPTTTSIAIMPATLEVESKLTDRYQTTVPETVRRALGLGKRDKIHYAVRADGEVVLTRAAGPEDDDPVLGRFLGFLTQDIARHPEHVQAVDVSLVRRLRSLTRGVKVDLDAALPDDDV